MAEMGTLGAMMLSDEARAFGAQNLVQDDFYNLVNGIIFGALVDMEHNGDRVDMVLLAHELRSRGVYEQVGGSARLIQIAECCSSALNVEYYAPIVASYSARRQLLQVRSMAHDAVDDGAALDSIISKIERHLDVVKSGMTDEIPPMADAIAEATARLQARSEGRETGIQTGIGKLDRILHGLKPSMLTILAGRPSDGKTSMLLNIIASACLGEQVPTLFFSAEMPKDQLVENLGRIITQVDYTELARGSFTASNYQKWQEAMRTIQQAPLQIDDTGAINIETLKRRAGTAVRRHGVKIVMVDYIQRLRTDLKAKRNLQVGYIAEELKTLASRERVHVIALSQIGRTSRDNPLPQLKWSGEQEEVADIVLRLAHEAKYDQPDSDDREPPVAARGLYIEKNRHGRVGKLDLTFDKRILTFTEAENEQ